MVEAAVRVVVVAPCVVKKAVGENVASCVEAEEFWKGGRMPVALMRGGRRLELLCAETQEAM